MVKKETKKTKIKKKETKIKEVKSTKQETGTDPAIVVALAKEIMDSYPTLKDWKFKLNSNKARLGVCRHNKKSIELSKYFIRVNDKSMVKKVILHELAHALIGVSHGHGPVFKKKCIELGITGEYAEQDVKMPDYIYNWHVVCEGCGFINKFVKKPNIERFMGCSKCNGTKLKLKAREI